jgi:hypothetical protein
MSCGGHGCFIILVILTDIMSKHGVIKIDREQGGEAPSVLELGIR